MTDREFFIDAMNGALETCRARVMAVTTYPDSSKQEMLARYTSIETSIYGHLGTAQMEALADALLNMEMTLWESFYRGYVGWTKSLPDCKFPPDVLEENARGAMLMALKSRIEDLKGATKK